MTPLKCVHLNSVTRLILITILVSIFSQSFDCKPHIVSVLTSEQGSVSQPIDPSITNDKPSGNNDTKGLTNISQPIDNDLRPQINLNNSLECTFGTCIYMAPPITTDKPARNNDTNGLDRKRQVVDPPSDGNFGDNANDDKSDEKDEFISPENLLFSLQDYKIVMEPSVEKVNALDYKVILHVNVRRKSDDGKVMELPSVAMYANNENPLALNSSIVESLKREFNGSLSHAKFNSFLGNDTRDTTGNSTNLTPTEFSVNLAEGPTNDPITYLSGRKNETTNAVSSPTLNTSESGINSENNTFDATSSTTMELPTTPEPIPNFTPLPSNEFDKRQENSTIQPETTTTSKLKITTITTSKPIDKTSASTLSSQVGSSETSHASSNAFTASTEVSRAVESRTISSTSNPLQTSSSSSTKPKMSEIELNHLKSLSDKQNYKPIKPIPETPWIPAYEVKPIGFNKQDTDNHIEYRFTQHEEEFNNRRNIPSNQPKLQPQPIPQPQPKLQPQPQLQSQPQSQLQPQPRPAPRLPPKSRYEPGMDMRSYNDRQPQVVKYEPYVPRNPSIPLKDLRANAPNNRNEPYAVEEIVHFEGPMQRLNTRQQKPSPELFVRIIRHYFENALSPAETIYTTKHKSPIIAPGQPVYQRSPVSLSYQNSKP